MRLMRTNNQHGDTIVEVLIAMAVAASVLAITYATMNRNLGITQANQERTTASKIVQGQLEALKTASTNPTLWGVIQGKVTSSFCMDPAAATLDAAAIIDTANPSVVPAAAIDSDNYADYGTCVDAGGLYHFAIRRSSAADPNKFDFYVRWDRIGGGREQIIMTYRI